MPACKPIMHPKEAVAITPTEYERQATRWLKDTGKPLKNFKVIHQEQLKGTGGEYTFDAVAELTILRGARIKLLIECKCTSRPVEREDVQVLWSKLQDVKAHKAMLFSTSGFQRGAIKYARKYKIALVVFIDGKLTYQTRNAFGNSPPPAGLDLPQYAGYVIQEVDEGINARMIDERQLEPLREWLETE